MTYEDLVEEVEDEVEEISMRIRSMLACCSLDGYYSSNGERDYEQYSTCQPPIDDQIYSLEHDNLLLPDLDQVIAQGHIQDVAKSRQSNNMESIAIEVSDEVNLGTVRINNKISQKSISSGEKNLSTQSSTHIQMPLEIVTPLVDAPHGQRYLLTMIKNFVGPGTMTVADLRRA